MNQNRGNMPGKDTHELWLNMKHILDREMPVQEKKRERILPWLFTPKGLLLLSTLVACTLTAVYLNIRYQNSYATQFVVTPNSNKVRPNSGFDDEVSISVPVKKKIKTGKINSAAPGNKTVVIGNVNSASEVQINNPSINVPNNSVSTKARNNIPSLQVQNDNAKTTVNANSVSHFSTTVEDGNTKHILLPKNNKGETVALITDQRTGSITKTNVSNSQVQKQLLVQNSIEPGNSFSEILQANNRVQFIAQSQQPYSVNLNTLQPDRINIAGDTKSDPVKRASMKGFTAGISVNYNKSLSNQEMTRVSYNGEENSIIDYLPSVYAQYHFNKKLFIQTELQFLSPQYTPELEMFQQAFDRTSTRYKDHAIALKKLYYLNIPVSLHYSPVKNFYVGTGLQFSQLRKSVLEITDCEWQKQGGNWKKVKETKSIAVKGNANKAAKRNNNGNGGGSTTTPAPFASQSDTAVMNLKSSDWRIVVEASYYYKRFGAGIRLNKGLNNYINTNEGNGIMKVKDKNESIQVYLRFNLLDRRKRK